MRERDKGMQIIKEMGKGDEGLRQERNAFPLNFKGLSY
jgi:hypothetical protein